MKVRDAIRRQPSTTEADRTIRAAAKQMNADAVGALLVTDDGLLVGIVTDRDLVVRGVANGVDVGARIDSMMSTDPVTIPATADLRDALKIFRTHPFRRLPVVDDDRLVGMLTVDDLVIDVTADLVDLARPITGQAVFGAPEAPPPATLT